MSWSSNHLPLDLAIVHRDGTSHPQKTKLWVVTLATTYPLRGITVIQDISIQRDHPERPSSFSTHRHRKDSLRKEVLRPLKMSNKRGSKGGMGLAMNEATAGAACDVGIAGCRLLVMEGAWYVQRWERTAGILKVTAWF